MSILRYDNKTHKWRPLTKEEVITESVDLEGKHPCDDCWIDARENGVYVWPVRGKVKFIRCPVCDRIIDCEISATDFKGKK